jgi:hypothetical protein
MKYSEFLQLREILEEQGITIQEFINNELNEQESAAPSFLGGLSFKRILKYYLLYWGGTKLWKLIQGGIKSAISSGIEKEFKDKMDADAIRIKEMLVNKLNLTNVKEKPVPKPNKEDQEIINTEKNTESEKTKESEPKPKSNESLLEAEKATGDENIQELEKQSKITIDKIIEKNYGDLSDKSKEEADKIRAEISIKVHKHRDEQIIRYMQKILKNESDIVLKSIEQKEKLSKEDRDNLRLYWEAKMTTLEIQLATLLSQAGYIDEKNLGLHFDELYDRLRKNVEDIRGKEGEEKKEVETKKGVFTKTAEEVRDFTQRF